MKINVRPQDCKFIINREAGKIVCIKEHTDELFASYLIRDDRLCGTFRIYRDDDALLMPNRFVGIATCSPDDEWDEEFGKKLAFMRMKRSLYKAFFSAAARFVDKVDMVQNYLVEKLNEFGAKVDANITNDEDYVNDYLGRAQ